MLNKEDTSDVFDDNINGVYNYKESVNPSKLVYAGCGLNEINNYILIINDNYKVFRSSCMGTFLKDEGNIDKLDIKQDGKDYYIDYKDHRYDKDTLTRAIVPENTTQKKMRKLEISNVQFLMEETEFEGNYYPIEIPINNNDMLVFQYNKDDSNTVLKQHFTIGNKRSKAMIYSFEFDEFSEFPYLRSFGKKIVAIEKRDNLNSNMKYGYKFVVFDETGIIYNLDQMFPITVNNESLTIENNSVYVMYDTKERVFKLFVGYNKKMCVEESDKHEPIFYEFRINYNYSVGAFEKPEFYKVGYEDEKCTYINNYINGG